MRSSKSILAGVAAGALAVGFLSVAGATSAGAAGAKSPKAAASTVSAVRAGAVGQIPTARMSLPAAMPLPTTLQVAGAPSNTATVYLKTAGGSYPVSTDDSATLLRSDAISGLADDSIVGIAVDTAGTYTVRLGNGSDTTSATFVTTGTPASIAWTPTAQTVLVGSTATMTLELKDSAGNLTQAALGDTIAIAASADDTPSTSSVTAADIYLGSAAITAVAQAGTQTITATPLGTLPPAVAAASTSLTGSGTVSATAVTNVVVTSPATAINIPAVAVTPVSATRTAQVPAGSTSIGIRIDDTTANPAGTQIRLGFTLDSAAVTAGASINGETVTSTDDTVFVNVNTDANKSASTTVTLGGAGANAGSVLSMRQYTVTNAVVSGVTLAVSELAPAVYGDDITFDPAGPLVGTIGTAVPVSVTVDDSFGTPQAGWTVQAWRNAATDVLLSTGTTNASGTATVTVANATGITSGNSEAYYFKAIPPVGTSVDSSAELSVAWTTSGGITSLSVAVSPGSSPIADPAGTAPTTGPLLMVPYDGTANTVSTATFDLAAGTAGGTANGGEVATLRPTATPANDVTVTVPLGSTGIFVSETASTAWNGGQTSVTVGSDDTVYVFGTKVGEHTVSVTSGGKTVAVKVKVQTSSDAAYNMAISPVAQEVTAGGITTATLEVTDVFGNAVATTDDTGAVTITASGGVLLAGYQTSASFTTNASGEATVTVIAGNAAGVGTLAATPKTGQKAPAWISPYTKPTGAPDPTTSAAAEVLVKATPVEKSIVIVGERTTVKGAAGIAVDGLTTGFADGDKVKPFVRFPGGSYTEGSARPAVEGDEFYWERKTGKKTYVFFTAENDESVKSNRVIIPAK